MSLSISRLPDRCPFCGAPTVQYAKRTSEGYYICTRCGNVFEDVLIDTGPEWRAYDAEERIARSRIGAPLSNTVHDRGVSTLIIPRVRDERALKLIQTQRKVRRGRDEKLVKILQEVNRIASRMGLPDRVRETLGSIVKILYRHNLLRKNNLYEYIGAAIFAAARINGYSISSNDIIENLGVSKERLWAAYRTLTFKLNISKRVGKQRPPKPTEYIARIASKLGLSSQVETLATRIAAELSRTGLAQGKPPQAIAAAAVYLASILLNEKRNQTQVARVINVTDATIRNRYRDIVDNFYIEVSL